MPIPEGPIAFLFVKIVLHSASVVNERSQVESPFRPVASLGRVDGNGAADMMRPSTWT